MKNQSAVEWLNEKIMELDVDFDCEIMSKEDYWIKRQEILEQAIEIEYDIQKEQYKRGHEHGRIEGYGEGYNEGIYDAENK